MEGTNAYLHLSKLWIQLFITDGRNGAVNSEHLEFV